MNLLITLIQAVLCKDKIFSTETHPLMQRTKENENNRSAWWLWSAHSRAYQIEFAKLLYMCAEFIRRKKRRMPLNKWECFTQSLRHAFVHRKTLNVWLFVVSGKIWKLLSAECKMHFCEMRKECRVVFVLGSKSLQTVMIC